MDLFSSTQQHEYIALTESLLKKSEDFIPEQEAEKVLDDLKKVINFHDKQYYTEAKPIISDYDYDRLFKKLKELEAAYPQLLHATQAVHAGLKPVGSAEAYTRSSVAGRTGDRAHVRCGGGQNQAVRTCRRQAGEYCP